MCPDFVPFLISSSVAEKGIVTFLPAHTHSAGKRGGRPLSQDRREE